MVCAVGLVTFPAQAALKSDVTACTHAIRQGTVQISAAAGCTPIPREGTPDIPERPKGTGEAPQWEACETAVRARTSNPGAAIRSFTIRTGSGVIVGTAPDRAQCESTTWSRIQVEAATRTSGSNVNSCVAVTKYSTAANAPMCMSTTSYVVGFKPSTSCPTAPAPRVRECPDGQLGAWAQTATVGPYPSCDVTWQPNEPPPGDCFTIDRTATLEWTPPTRNTDGSTLTNLAGYRIHYGTSAAAQTNTVQVSNPSVRRYVLTNLLPAVWFFSVRAYTASDESSDVSNTVQKTVR